MKPHFFVFKSWDNLLEKNYITSCVNVGDIEHMNESFDEGDEVFYTTIYLRSGYHYLTDLNIRGILELLLDVKK